MKLLNNKEVDFGKINKLEKQLLRYEDYKRLVMTSLEKTIYDIQENNIHHVRKPSAVRSMAASLALGLLIGVGGQFASPSSVYAQESVRASAGEAGRKNEANLEGSLIAAQEAVRKDPNSAQARYQLADAYRDSDNDKEAYQQLEWGVKLDDHFAEKLIEKDEDEKALSLLYRAHSHLDDFGMKDRSKEIFDKIIDIEMSKDSPRDILERCKGMTFIDYDKAGRWKSEYFAEVFQEGSRDKKPVLVLFYNNTPKENVKEFGMRQSIIFKKLFDKYAGKIKMVAVNLPVNPREGDAYMDMCKKAGLPSSDPMGIFSNDEIKDDKQLPPLRGPPSIAMYSPYDVVQRETPENNDGKMKLIDVLFEAPATDGQIHKMALSLPNYWIDINVTKPNGKYLYRFNNTFKLNTIKY